MTDVLSDEEIEKILKEEEETATRVFLSASCDILKQLRENIKQKQEKLETELDDTLQLIDMYSNIKIVKEEDINLKQAEQLTITLLKEDIKLEVIEKLIKEKECKIE